MSKKWNNVPKIDEEIIWNDTRRYNFQFGTIEKFGVKRNIVQIALPETIPIEKNMEVMKEMQQIIEERINLNDYDESVEKLLEKGVRYC